VCRDFLRALVARGLRYEDGLLCVLDGAKGFHSAVRSVFEGCALIQRCRWHKRENVLSYLSECRRSAMRQKIQAAYRKPTYEKAKAALKAVRAELSLMNESAAKSLDEGLEETLTLHRLGLAAELGLSFSTVNVIESIQALTPPPDPHAIRQVLALDRKLLDFLEAEKARIAEALAQISKCRQLLESYHGAPPRSAVYVERLG